MLLDAYGTALAKSSTPFSRPHVLTGLFYLLESIRPPKIRTTNNSSSSTLWILAGNDTQKFHSLIYVESSILISQNVHNYHMLAKHMFLVSLCFYFVVLLFLFLLLDFIHMVLSCCYLSWENSWCYFFPLLICVNTFEAFSNNDTLRQKLAKLFQLCILG